MFHIHNYECVTREEFILPLIKQYAMNTYGA